MSDQEQGIHYGPTHAIQLRQELMNNIEQNKYSSEQMKAMLLAAVSSSSHYWDLDLLLETANRLNKD